MNGATLPLATGSFTGRTLGKYRVICRLSTGGMSEIYLAYQKGLAGFRKLVVLKSILPDIRGEEEFVRMFLDEARITAAFNHPNIAQVYDLDIDDGELFLAMEFVPGATLVEVARACRLANEPIPTGLTLSAVRDTALALHYAHTFMDPLGRKQTVIHRDVAEKNIMVTYDGTTKLLDFGIAKSLNRAGRTTVGMVKGTSGYMSPEQILGEKLDTRSDIFSLGVVLHECLTGMRLFHGKNPEDGMMAALREEVAPPSRRNSEVPPELDAVVLKALARRREERFSTALEFAREVERVVAPMIWHPEQTGEFVQRLFNDRREQSQKLFEQAQLSTDEHTGEVRLEAILSELLSSEGRASPKTERGAESAILSVVEPPTPAPRRSDPPPRAANTIPPLQSVRDSAPPVPAQEDEVVIAEQPTPLTSAVVRRTGPPPLSSSAPPVPYDDQVHTDDGEGDAADELTVVNPVYFPGESPDRIGTNPNMTMDDEDEPDLKTIPAAVLPSSLTNLPPQRRQTSGPFAPVPETVHDDDLTAGANPDAFDDFTDTGTRRQSSLWSVLIGLVLAIALFGTLAYLFRPQNNPEPLTSPPIETPVTAVPPVTEKAQPAPTEVSAPADVTGSAASATAVSTPSPTPEAAPPTVPDGVPATPAAAGTNPTTTEAAEPPTTAVTAGSSVESDEAAKAAKVQKRRKRRAAWPEPEPLESTERLTGPGSLSLITEPVAHVYFKAQDMGMTPLTKVNLPPGQHVLRLSSELGVRFLSVEVKSGKETTLRVSLDDLVPEP